MKRVGLIGWRGMVGSVLMQRMREENDFADIEPIFFTTSQAGKPAPDVGKEGVPALQDAFDIETLKTLDVVVTARAGITPARSTRNSVTPDGRVTGSTPRPHCGWLITP